MNNEHKSLLGALQYIYISVKSRHDIAYEINQASWDCEILTEVDYNSLMHFYNI